MNDIAPILEKQPDGSVVKITKEAFDLEAEKQIIADAIEKKKKDTETLNMVKETLGAQIVSLESSIADYDQIINKATAIVESYNKLQK